MKGRLSALRVLELLLVILSLFAQCSCVSTLLERSTNRHRSILAEESSQAEIRKAIGPPSETWQKTSGESPLYQSAGAYAYDAFLVRGRVARPGDGAAQATVNAVTLGTSEAITLPLTLVGVATKPFTTQKLIVFYDRDLLYKTHQIFDRKGRKIDTLGY